jgi:hypothetical protein
MPEGHYKGIKEGPIKGLGPDVYGEVILDQERTDFLLKVIDFWVDHNAVEIEELDACTELHEELSKAQERMEFPLHGKFTTASTSVQYDTFAQHTISTNGPIRFR